MSMYNEFLSQYDYDVRKLKDARWIDQKCTYDVVSIIADCINEYVENSNNKEFTVSDIWHSDYARENVISIFSKPDPELKASNEYDKYFGQPIKLLGYSHVLNVRKDKNRYFYSINNQEILSKIALRPMNALNFLYEYITKVLSDSGLIESFNDFFNIQTNEAYKNVRDKFINFTISNTKIRNQTECGRIFTKVINPLAFKLKKFGTEKGRISRFAITLNDLQYNRSNWRDELSGKDKSIPRSEYEIILSKLQERAFRTYTVNKAKKAVRKFNDIFNNGQPEVIQSTEHVKATQAHHIFPQSNYPDIADFIENLIMLTPNQHYSMAHPNNNTQYIDKDFQYLCLIAKTTRIHNDLTSNNTNKFYDFNDYKYVLNIGLETDEFSSIEHLDFATILDKIDFFYSDQLIDNKYAHLIKDNRL
ncbi:restriction endonuclease Hin4II [Ureaplasma diversum]|uniref:Restriction endonuclease Hin4II n=2 Tax=Ureaplasma diversum TaxID=42094 RepID=A0A0C5S2M4_9BACT|nr:restriction endonuclease Hin4II [Ureaplasma diversum]